MMPSPFHHPIKTDTVSQAPDIKRRTTALWKQMTEEEREYWSQVFVQKRETFQRNKAREELLDQEVEIEEKHYSASDALLKMPATATGTAIAIDQQAVSLAPEGEGEEEGHYDGQLDDDFEAFLRYLSPLRLRSISADLGLDSDHASACDPMLLKERKRNGESGTTMSEVPCNETDLASRAYSHPATRMTQVLRVSPIWTKKVTSSPVGMPAPDQVLKIWNGRLSYQTKSVAADVTVGAEASCTVPKNPFCGNGPAPAFCKATQNNNDSALNKHPRNFTKILFTHNFGQTAQKKERKSHQAKIQQEKEGKAAVSIILPPLSVLEEEENCEDVPPIAVEEVDLTSFSGEKYQRELPPFEIYIKRNKEVTPEDQLLHGNDKLQFFSEHMQVSFFESAADAIDSCPDDSAIAPEGKVDEITSVASDNTISTVDSENVADSEEVEVEEAGIEESTDVPSHKTNSTTTKEKVAAGKGKVKAKKLKHTNTKAQSSTTNNATKKVRASKAKAATASASAKELPKKRLSIRKTNNITNQKFRVQSKSLATGEHQKHKKSSSISTAAKLTQVKRETDADHSRSRARKASSIATPKQHCKTEANEVDETESATPSVKTENAMVSRSIKRDAGPGQFRSVRATEEYTKYHRGSIRRQHPKLSFSERRKLLIAQWQEESEEEKETFRALARKKTIAKQRDWFANATQNVSAETVGDHVDGDEPSLVACAKKLKATSNTMLADDEAEYAPYPESEGKAPGDAGVVKEKELREKHSNDEMSVDLPRPPQAEKAEKYVYCVPDAIFLSKCMAQTKAKADNANSTEQVDIPFKISQVLPEQLDQHDSSSSMSVDIQQAQTQTRVTEIDQDQDEEYAYQWPDAIFAAPSPTIGQKKDIGSLLSSSHSQHDMSVGRIKASIAAEVAAKVQSPGAHSETSQASTSYPRLAMSFSLLPKRWPSHDPLAEPDDVARPGENENICSEMNNKRNDKNASPRFYLTGIDDWTQPLFSPAFSVGEMKLPMLCQQKNDSTRSRSLSAGEPISEDCIHVLSPKRSDDETLLPPATSLLEFMSPRAPSLPSSFGPHVTPEDGGSGGDSMCDTPMLEFSQGILRTRNEAKGLMSPETVQSLSLPPFGNPFSPFTPKTVSCLKDLVS
jgi:hypothetical protein